MQTTSPRLARHSRVALQRKYDAAAGSDSRRVIFKTHKHGLSPPPRLRSAPWFQPPYITFFVKYTHIPPPLCLQSAPSFQPPHNTFLSRSWVSSVYTCIHLCNMGWPRLIGSLKLQVSFAKESFAKESYKRDDILQKRRIVSRSLLIVATAYHTMFLFLHSFVSSVCTYTYSHAYSYTYIY